MKHFTYIPEGTCARQIDFDIDQNGLLRNVTFTQGCPGNTSGVAKLAEGRPASEVAAMLRGTDCRGRGTSCPDQYSKAILAALVQR